MKLWFLALVPLAACPGTPPVSSNSGGSGGCTNPCNCGEVGTLQALQTTLDFGGVALGTTETLAVQVTNTGECPVVFSSFDFTGAGPSGYSVTMPLSNTLAPNASASIQVSLTPTLAMALSAQLEISSNAENDPLVIELVGAGTNCGCAPLAVSFGAIPLGLSPPATQTITCAATTPIGCTVSVDAQHSDPPFAVTDANGPVSANTQQNVTLDASYVFTVTYEPSRIETDSASLTLTQCSGSCSTDLVPLTGSAAGCSLAVTPSPIAFSSAERAQTVAVSNIGSLPVRVPCLGLASVGDAGCAEASAAFAFSEVPTLPLALGPNQDFAFTLTANGFDAGDTLQVACVPTGSDLASSFTAPITERP